LIEMHRIKVGFLGGSWRTITFDEMLLNGPFVIFNLGDETVLTAVTRNMTFFEPVEDARAPSRPTFGSAVLGLAFH
jgi:hypothetical protein